MAEKGASVPQFASLYVGDLNADVTEAMLYEIFNSVGPVASIRVCRDNVSRKSLGYGYVNFHSVTDAERALDTLNYSSIKGRSCRIMWSQRDPSLRKSGAGNIYVKNLDKNIDNKALYDTFSLFGNILSCKVASDSKGASYGYGFVHYETDEAAKQAIERVNGMKIGEQTVEVTLFLARNERPKPDLTNYTNLYIKGIPNDWTEEKLKEEFTKFGTITSSALRSDNKGRKMGFVNYEESAMAHKAVEEMNMKEMRTDEEIAKAKEDGKEDEVGPDGHPVGKLYVGRAQTKLERSIELREKFGASGGKGGSDSKESGVNLYIKNLDESTTDESLKELFASFGEVASASAPQDEKGKSKGFGFVCFASPDTATKAVTEMHLKVINGKPLYVGLAEKKEARQERLRNRYTPGGDMKGGKGGKGKGKGGPGAMGGMGPPMGMPQMGMMGMMGGKGPGPMMGMPQPMMGQKGMPQPMMQKGMMPNPQMMGMMGMMGKGGPGMMPGMMPGKGMPGMMPGMMPQGMMPPGAKGMPQMGGKGMPQMQMARPQGPGPQQGATQGGAGLLNAAALAAAAPNVQKQMIGEKLFPAIQRLQPEMAGKITGMMLEMDNSELLILLESEQQLKNKVDEAMNVLQASK